MVTWNGFVRCAIRFGYVPVACAGAVPCEWCRVKPIPYTRAMCSFYRETDEYGRLSRRVSAAPATAARIGKKISGFLDAVHVISSWLFLILSLISSRSVVFCKSNLAIASYSRTCHRRARGAR